MTVFTRQIKRSFLDSCASITQGTLRLRTPEGENYVFGAGQPEAELRIFDWSMVTACAARGDIGFGETYVAGLWDSPSIADLTAVSLLNLKELESFAYPNFWQTLKYRVVNTILRANSKRGAARNIRSHYDVGNEFYQLWLDHGMTYSSGIFASGEDDLDQAQMRKIDRILGRLAPGDRVLEVGCGWGSFAEAAAENGRAVTGITISPSQKGYADARLDGRADIQLKDYRNADGTFDSIVSIEMIEAVGERYWPTYFSMLKNRLAAEGRVLLQAITVPDSYFELYRKGSDFIRQHTFPGGMLLSDGQIRKQAESAGLVVRDTFSFGDSYAETLRIWQNRLDNQSDRIRQLGYGEEFLRSWRFYLGICAASFRTGQTNVMQVELAHAD